MAGVTGFEPAIDGFGVRRSSSRASPLHLQTGGNSRNRTEWAGDRQLIYSQFVRRTRLSSRCQRSMAEGWRVERQSPEGAAV